MRSIKFFTRFVLTMTCGSLGIAWAGDAAAENHSATLHVTGLTVDVPVEWSIAEGSQGNKRFDLFRRDTADWTITISLVWNSPTCNYWIQGQPAAARVEGPSWLPASWFQWVAQGKVASAVTEQACLQTDGRGLYAGIAFTGDPAKVDFSPATAILDALAKAAGVSAPPPPPPPPTTTKTRLHATGRDIDLPEGWTSFLGPDQKTDVIRRVTPPTPRLSIVLENYDDPCMVWENDEDHPNGTKSTDNDFLADDWHDTVFVFPKTSTMRVEACLDLTPAGKAIVAQIDYPGDPTGDDFDVTGVLDAIANGTAVSETPPAPTPPAPTTVTTPSPAPAPTPSPVSTSSPTPAPPPPPAHETTAEQPPPSEPVSSGPGDVWLQLFGYQLSPKDAAVGQSLGGGLSIGRITYTTPSAVSFAMAYDGTLSFDGNKNVGTDGQFAIGLGLHASRFWITPLVGVGADSLGGGEETQFHFPFAFWYAPEVVLGMHLFSNVGIEARGARLFRGSDDLPNENRIGGRLLIGKYAVGVRYTEYEHRIDHLSASALAGTLGVAF